MFPSNSNTFDSPFVSKNPFDDPYRVTGDFVPDPFEYTGFPGRNRRIGETQDTPDLPAPAAPRGGFGRNGGSDLGFGLGQATTEFLNSMVSGLNRKAQNRVLFPSEPDWRTDGQPGVFRGCTEIGCDL